MRAWQNQENLVNLIFSGKKRFFICCRHHDCICMHFEISFRKKNFPFGCHFLGIYFYSNLCAFLWKYKGRQNYNSFLHPPYSELHYSFVRRQRRDKRWEKKCKSCCCRCLFVTLYALFCSLDCKFLWSLFFSPQVKM